MGEQLRFNHSDLRGSRWTGSGFTRVYCTYHKIRSYLWLCSRKSVIRTCWGPRGVWICEMFG